MPDDLLAKAVTFCFASDAPAGDLPHDVVHTLMADFARTAIASAVKSERERIADELQELNDGFYNDEAAEEAMTRFIDQLRGENNGN